MGSPRVTSRPSAPRGGGGTGGGTTGGGTTSVSGYDRYIGTLGATAPTGSKFPHHATFPVAEKYDWVRVVTTTTINNQAVIEGQEWICNAKTAVDLPANWELRSAFNSTAFGSGALEVKRELDIAFSLPPNVFTLIAFNNDYVFTAGDKAVAHDRYRTDLSLWFPSVFDDLDSLLDFDLVVNFGEEPSGDRYIAIATLEYSNPPTFGTHNPDGTLVRGNGGISTAPASPEFEYINSMKIEGRSYVAATTQSQASIRSGETARLTRYFSEMQTLFYVWVWQNSQKIIDVEKVSLSIRNRFPRGIL
jgi:hypothetical protein